MATVVTPTAVFYQKQPKLESKVIANVAPTTSHGSLVKVKVIRYLQNLLHSSVKLKPQKLSKYTVKPYMYRLFFPSLLLRLLQFVQ